MSNGKKARLLMELWKIQKALSAPDPVIFVNSDGIARIAHDWPAPLRAPRLEPPRSESSKRLPSKRR